MRDRKISKRPGYAGWAVATTAGNAVAVPAVVGLADKSLEAYVPQATAQVAASVVITAILVPIVTNWWAHKYGCPKFPLEERTSVELSGSRGCVCIYRMNLKGCLPEVC